MKKAVITGATGMIGNALLHECIKNNVEVLAIVRPNSKYLNRMPDSALVHICECNLSDYGTFDFSRFGSNWDVFYHFAWNYTSSQFRNNVELQTLNIGYTIDSVKIAKSLGCYKYVGAGSQAEYGLIRTEKIDPDSPTNPHTAYGIAKLAAGKLAGVYAYEQSLDFVWGRIFSVYGIYDSPDTMISTAISKMLKGERMSFTSGTQLWDYLYCEDAGRAFYLLNDVKAKNKVYCIGSGICQPLYEYIHIIRNCINPELELGIGDIRYNNGLISNLCSDISSLTADTGFAPIFDFKKGVQDILKSIVYLK